MVEWPAATPWHHYSENAATTWQARGLRSVKCPRPRGHGFCTYSWTTVNVDPGPHSITSFLLLLKGFLF